MIMEGIRKETDIAVKKIEDLVDDLNEMLYRELSYQETTNEASVGYVVEHLVKAQDIKKDIMRCVDDMKKELVEAKATLAVIKKEVE